MERYQLSEDIEKIINRAPGDNRRAPAATHRGRAQVRCRYRLQPRLHTWIETHILDVSGWGWRQFTEAAVASVLSPEWLHPTWHANYIARGIGNRPIDATIRARQVGFTPFLDEIPHARALVAGIEPYAYAPAAPERGLIDVCYDTTQAAGHGYVVFEWLGHTHAFLAELGSLVQYANNDPHQSNYRRGARTLSAAEVARLCVNAHFERSGVLPHREAMFQVWREYCAMRAGYQNHVPTQTEAYETMRRNGLIQMFNARVPIHAASLGEHMGRTIQYECGLWPERVLQRFVDYSFHPSQERPSTLPP